MRDEPNAGLERQSVRPCGAQKGRWSIQTAGRWSWKSKPAKECVTTHLPNGPAPKMDGAGACRLYPAIGAERLYGPMSRGAWGSRRSPRGRPRVERALVRILVVVASVQTGALRAEVGKGSM